MHVCYVTSTESLLVRSTTAHSDPSQVRSTTSSTPKCKRLMTDWTLNANSFLKWSLLTVRHINGLCSRVKVAMRHAGVVCSPSGTNASAHLGAGSDKRTSCRPPLPLSLHTNQNATTVEDASIIGVDATPELSSLLKASLDAFMATLYVMLSISHEEKSLTK